MVPHIINHPERLNQHKTTDTTLIAAPSDRVRRRDQQPVNSALWGYLCTVDGKRHQINTVLSSSVL